MHPYNSADQVKAGEQLFALAREAARTHSTSDPRSEVSTAFGNSVGVLMREYLSALEAFGDHPGPALCAVLSVLGEVTGRTIHLAPPEARDDLAGFTLSGFERGLATGRGVAVDPENPPAGGAGAH